MHLNKAVLLQLRDRARADVDAGLEHGGVEGCALAVGYQNEIVFEEGYGAATADTPILMLSVTKTVLEAALWKLFAGELRPETPIVEIIPDFMDGTQPGITIAMVETHVAGFAWNRLEYPNAADRGVRLAAFRSWRLERKPAFLLKIQ